MLNQTTSQDPNQRATEFQPVVGGEETTSGEALLIAAYAIMWLLVLFFVWTSWRKQLGLGERLARLEQALNQPSNRGPT
ncbi:MAG TPA: CcmD family protein [Polyangiaceae bacterium]|nr:CcmD family protein [Polyangiaceae bacterium]